MKFLVVKKGAGEGCDYTIGCNMDYDIIDSNYPIEVVAARQVEDAVFHGERGYYERDQILINNEDNPIRELIVVPMDNAVIPDLNKIRREHNDKVIEARKADAEANERAEFERLKKKFGN